MTAGVVRIDCIAPFDLGLCLRAMRSFGRSAASDADAAETARPELRLGVWLDGKATLVVAQQTSFEPATVEATSRPAGAPAVLRRMMERVLNARLDLRPFYAEVEAHKVLGPLTRQLRGLKPFRPAGLFDMLVMAVTEQQISLAVARHLQERLIARFGDQVGGVPVFPRPEILARASIEELMDCGLSRRKSEYVIGVAQAVVSGDLDLNALETAPAEEVRARISALRGFGPWSADYVLIRGLGRADVVPVDDLGVRTVLGRMLGDGSRLSPAETEEALAPFAPYRGLATFYLLVGTRLAVPPTP